MLSGRFNLRGIKTGHDKNLMRSIDWAFLSADGVQDVLREYAANKAAARL
jgi:hypothetical protein